MQNCRLSSNKLVSFSVKEVLRPPPQVPAAKMFFLKGEVKAKIKISPVVVFGVLSRMVLVRGS